MIEEAACLQGRAVVEAVLERHAQWQFVCERVTHCLISGGTGQSSWPCFPVVMRTTPFDAKLAEDTVLVRPGSTGLHLEFPEGTRELEPGTDLVLPYRRLRSWMELRHRLYCNDADLGEITFDMQDEQAASTVARMMMTLALRLREAEAQSDCAGPDAQAVGAEQDATVVPVPHDASCEQPSTSFR